jgi:rhodanese-related sulfurtransferase
MRRVGWRIAAVLLVGGCTMPLPRAVRAPAPEPQPLAAVACLSAAEAHTLLVKSARDERLVVLDVRTPEEFAAGHMEDAVNLDVRAPDFAVRMERLDRTRPYLVYCAHGMRSALAVAKMQLAGFGELYDLQGGLEAWIAAGYVTVKGP